MKREAQIVAIPFREKFPSQGAGGTRPQHSTLGICFGAETGKLFWRIMKQIKRFVIGVLSALQGELEDPQHFMYPFHLRIHAGSCR